MTDHEGGCDHIEVDASINMTFEVCRTHGQAQPKGGYINSPGVNLMLVADTALAALEHGLATIVGEYPDLLAMAQTDYDDGFGPLPERAHAHIARLLAHQLLLDKVKDRDYANGRLESAMLTLPKEFLG